MEMDTVNGGAPKLRYRPVVLVHGRMNGDVSSMQQMAVRITELHPGTKTYVINRFCGPSCFDPLWQQTLQFCADLKKICASHPEGVHLIGYSQGGLVARGVLELCGSTHNVRTFVSLSSPQGGHYSAECFTRLVPALKTSTAYEMFYTQCGQFTMSVANYWNDYRHRDLFLKYNFYLAVIDNAKNRQLNDNRLQYLDVMLRHHEEGFTVLNTTNNVVIKDTDENTKFKEARGLFICELIADTAHHLDRARIRGDRNWPENCFKTEFIQNKILGPEQVEEIRCLTDLLTDVNLSDDNNVNVVREDFAYASSRRLGITRLQRMILIGGPDDGVISPWQSSQFAVWDSSGSLIPMRKRVQDDIYSNYDPIGLRELDKSNRLIEITVPGIQHHEWHRNDSVLLFYQQYLIIHFYLCKQLCTN